VGGKYREQGKEKGPKKKKKPKGQQGQQLKKTLTMVLCWLTEGQKQDEKKTPKLWTEWPTGAVIGGWFTLARTPLERELRWRGKTGFTNNKLLFVPLRLLS